MTDNSSRGFDDGPIGGAPVWIRALQAAVIGVFAGLALNAILSLVPLQGQGLTPKREAPKECKKQGPSKDAVSPRSSAPTVGAVTWTVEGLQASYGLVAADAFLSP
jgi:hypothetical protein